MRHLFAFTIFLIALFGPKANGQVGTSRDPACCSCGGGYPTTTCSTPISSAGVLTADCGAGGACSGCPTCAKRANPDFSKECSVNMVFIIDNSGSLESFCQGIVRPALSQFFSGLQTVVSTGGNVRTAVIAFQDTVTLVYPMTLVDTAGSFIGEVQRWVSGLPSNTASHPGYCQDMGGTNWGGALQFARSQNYGIAVDIWIMFSDGYPQCAGTYAPQTSCSKSCFNAGNSFFNTLCNPSSSCRFGTNGISFSGNSDDTPSGLWTACYHADQMKAMGSKFFFIGVGGLNGHESKIQLITGTRQWDGLASSFGTSDYIISTDYNNMALIFRQVLSGLCSCLQGQPRCTDATGVTNSCRATEFAAWARISTQATTVSTVLPAASTTVAYLYYSFVASPNTRVAYQFWSPGQAVTAAGVVVRTDYLNPCRVQRRAACGGQCYEVAETQYLPRFFHEQGDTPCTGNVCAGALFAPPDCPRGWIKAAGTRGENIRFLWTLADGVEPCAAQAVDGTFYEFFKNNGPLTPGVRNLGSAPQTLPASTGAFNFFPTQTCNPPVCKSDVELVVVIDEQASISGSTFLAMKNFAANVVTRLQPGPTYSASSRFGVVFTSSYAPPYPQAPTILSGMGPAPNLATNLIVAHKQNNGTADFSTVINYALNKYWGSAPQNGIKRTLLVMVGGPDVGTSNYAPLATTLNNMGVESFVVGVDGGAGNLAVLGGLASVGTFQHYLGVLNPTDLSAGSAYENLMASTLCPQTNLCGPQCLGFCECSSQPTCKCPGCSQTNPCTSYSCSATQPQLGCIGQPVNCDDNNACTTDTCTVPGGCSNVRRVCPLANQACINSTGECKVGTPCTGPVDCLNTACYDQQCITDLCVPVSSRTCNDGNVCTIDTCVNPVGCVYTPRVCEQTSTCFTLTCQGALPNGQPNCVPTEARNCTDNDGCTIDSCVERFGCQNKNITCNPTNGCNFAIGCIGRDSLGREMPGDCIISNATCVPLSVAQIVGISIGVIIGIVIAAIIAALLIAFFSKKGYDAYQAKSALSQPSMHDNPTFKDNSNVAYTQF